MVFSPAKSLGKGEVVVPFIQKFVSSHIKSVGWKQFEASLMRIRDKFTTDDLSFYDQKMASSESGVADTYYSDWFHLSGAVRCMAEQWFGRMSIPEMKRRPDDDFRAWQIFGTGDAMHLRWQALLSLSGALLGREDTASFSFPEFKCQGKADGILSIPGDAFPRRLLELKSANRRYFTGVQKSGPMFAHVVQANGYMGFLDLPVASIVYECKDDHTVAEFSIEFDPELFDWTVMERMDALEVHIAEKSLPFRENALAGSKPSKDCHFCAYNHVCFSPNLLEMALRDMEEKDAKQCSSPARKQKLAKIGKKAAKKSSRATTI